MTHPQRAPGSPSDIWPCPCPSVHLPKLNQRNASGLNCNLAHAACATGRLDEPYPLLSLPSASPRGRPQCESRAERRVRPEGVRTVTGADACAPGITPSKQFTPLGWLRAPGRRLGGLAVARAARAAHLPARARVSIAGRTLRGLSADRIERLSTPHAARRDADVPLFPAKLLCTPLAGADMM